jgi:hypothetical protein
MRRMAKGGQHKQKRTISVWQPRASGGVAAYLEHRRELGDLRRANAPAGRKHRQFPSLLEQYEALRSSSQWRRSRARRTRDRVFRGHDAGDRQGRRAGRGQDGRDSRQGTGPRMRPKRRRQNQTHRSVPDAPGKAAGALFRPAPLPGLPHPQTLPWSFPGPMPGKRRARKGPPLLG